MHAGAMILIVLLLRSVVTDKEPYTLLGREEHAQA